MSVVERYRHYVKKPDRVALECRVACWLRRQLRS
jgi:hypothetical protein